MDDLLKQIKQYKEPLVIGLAILMLIFYGFCPVIDILGKAKANGLKVLFEGSGLGFSRFLSLLILLAPLLVVVGKPISTKLTGMLKDNLCIICFLAGIVLCLLFAVVLPNGVSPAWGCWLYILAGVLGAGVCRIEMFTK
ncbi:hypothetical protein [Leyella stercorea]|uniref:hypothetical protein n=1 Tax=Leyella stercorea TaxID=363265 RepID=UPI0024309358|nr:hypothetical protein [Leyella stercorea]